MKLARLFPVLIVAAAAHAQTWDTSGNGMLNGTYYFRQVYYVLGDQNGDLGEAVALYGNIKFDGNGNYSITKSENAVFYDTSVGAGPLTATGTYSIAASGYGFISSPYVSNDVIFGMVSAQGIFVGSSTDNANGYNDMMIAAPLASPVPTNSSFTGSWVCADFDFSSGSPASALSTLFPLSPDGNGNLGDVTVTGYYGGGGTSVVTQTSNGLKYSFSNGAAVATFPNNGSLVSGQKYFYFSKDGNFLFGGSPYTGATPFDMIVGVKNTGTSTVQGLYYQAGVDEVNGDFDSYFGSFTMIGGAAPQTYLGHERINDYGGFGLTDYTYTDTLSLSGNTASTPYARWVAGDGGSILITAGTGPYLGISVSVQAPNPTGTGVFLSPTGIVNSASNAPFTASIAPGELLTMYGSNLASATKVAGIPFPTTLGNVQVSIGGLPAPIYYVSSGQISAIVPYGITGSTATIQVTNNGTPSNVVYEWVGTSAPGVFTQNQNGTGFGEIEHLGIGNSTAAPGSVVTTANPAIPGETLAVYLTGLGAVSPGINDGDPGPSPTLANATNVFNLYVGSSAAITPGFAGLAPGYSGLYQLNFTLPTTGLTTGANNLTIQGPDATMSYTLLPIGSTVNDAATANARTAEMAEPARPRPPKATTPGKSNRRVLNKGGN